MMDQDDEFIWIILTIAILFLIVKEIMKNEAEEIERPNNLIGGYQPRGISYTPTNPPKGGSSQQDN